MRNGHDFPIRIVALDAHIGVAADALEMHEDPADRFIVATALECEAPLVTRDRAIRSAKLVEVVW